MMVSTWMVTTWAGSLVTVAVLLSYLVQVRFEQASQCPALHEPAHLRQGMTSIPHMMCRLHASYVQWYSLLVPTSRMRALSCGRVQLSRQYQHESAGIYSIVLVSLAMGKRSAAVEPSPGTCRRMCPGC